MARIVWDGKREARWIAEKVVQPTAEVEAEYGVDPSPWPSPFYSLSFYPEPQPADPHSRSLNAVEEQE